MSTFSDSKPIKEKKVIDLFIKLFLVVILVAWCVMIILPFLSVILWGVILAITLFPLYQNLTKLLRGRNKMASFVIITILLFVMIIPTIWLIVSIVEEAKALVANFQNNTMVIPQPNPEVASWPLIGKPLYNAWQMLVTNMGALVVQYKDPLIDFSKTFLSSLLGVGSNFIMFIFSLIISGFLLLKTEATEKYALAFSNHMIGKRGEEFLGIITQTVRNVAKGILGVAFIQFVLAGTAFLFAGIPFAGLWAFLVLILAIIQMPVSIVTIPAAIYLFSVKEPLPAGVWTIVFLLIGLIDNVLKPYLMGKGSTLPLLVVFLGAIGGFMFSGFMGLFTGAIVLSLGYKLLGMWLQNDEADTHIEEENINPVEITK